MVSALRGREFSERSWSGSKCDILGLVEFVLYEASNSVSRRGERTLAEIDHG